MEKLPDNVIPLFKPRDPGVERMIEILSRDIDELALEVLPEEEVRKHEENRQSIILARNNPQGLGHFIIGSLHKAG